MKTKEAAITVTPDPETFNKFNRIDEYYPITEKISKTFRFKINEPMFLVMLVNFEKEISGGSLAMAISHVPKGSSTSADAKKNQNIPLLFTSDTFDGTLFGHQRLEPYLSG
jgi:hypothetical protein